MYTVGCMALLLLSIVNLGFYKYDLEIPTSVLFTTCTIGCTFLYMCYEYFKTQRLFEALENRIKELENEHSEAIH